MMLFLPLISVLYGGFLPAGLFIYWIVATVFSIVQQYLIVGWGGMFPFFGWTPGLRQGPHAALPGDVPRHRIRPSANARRARQSARRPTSRSADDHPPAESGAARADEGDDADMSAYQRVHRQDRRGGPPQRAREAFGVGL